MDDCANFDLFGSTLDFLFEDKINIFEDHSYCKQIADDNEQENLANKIFAEEITENVLHDLLNSDMSVDDNENEQVVAESSRFANLDEEQLNEIAAANSEQSTKRQTKWAVEIFKGMVYHIWFLFV